MSSNNEEESSATTLDFHGEEIDSKNVQYVVGQGAMNSNAATSLGGGGGLQSQQFNKNTSSNNNTKSPDSTNDVLLPWTQIFCCCCIPITSYQKYFDFNTEDIIQRIKGSILYVNKPDYFREQLIGHEKESTTNSQEEQVDIERSSSLSSSIHNNKGPDLYAPIWITLTFIFLLSVTSNATAYLHSSNDDFEYDITHLATSVILLFSFLIGLPTFFYLVLKCLLVRVNQHLSWVDLVCLYGYSLVPYLPATILCCLLPFTFLEWIFLLSATILSVLLILRNVSSPILQSSGSHARSYASAVLSAVMIFHVAFLLILKFGFYHHPRSRIVPSPSMDGNNSTSSSTKEDDTTSTDVPGTDHRFFW